MDGRGKPDHDSEYLPPDSARLSNTPKDLLMPTGFWSPARDQQLRDGEAAGLSAAQIARALGTTRSAVLGRSARLRGLVFKSQLERQANAKLESRKRVAAESRAIAAMATDIQNGMQRNEAMVRARVAGATLRGIGDYFGITREAVRQATQRPIARVDKELNALSLASSPYGPGGAYPSVRTLRREQRRLSKQPRP